MSVTTTPEEAAVKEEAASVEPAIRDAIKGLRLQRRFSQGEAAKGMGKPLWWYQEREASDRGITADDLFLFAGFFGVPADALREGSEVSERWVLEHHPDCPAARLAANLRSGSAVQESLFPIAA